MSMTMHVNNDRVRDFDLNIRFGDNEHVLNIYHNKIELYSLHSVTSI